MFGVKLLCLIFSVINIPKLISPLETPSSFLETEKQKQSDFNSPSKVTHHPFNASADAKHLNDAVVGLGTDENKIIRVITSRTNKQRQEIRKAYKEQFHKDLIEDLKDDTSGNFRSVVVALMLEPSDFLTNELHKQLTSILPSALVVSEILCTKSKTQLQPMIDMYYTKFNTTLRDDIEENIEESLKSFLKNIISDQKSLRADSGVSNDMIEKQLQSIPDHPDFCQPAENKVLFDFLSKESFEHINKVSNLYEAKSNLSETVFEQLETWCSEDALKEAYQVVVYYAMNPAEFYAKYLNIAMIGLGTNDHTLIRIIVGRSEIDLTEIKNSYKQLYNTTLASSVEQETSGSYKKILLEMISK